jgi:hypothetical protein
MSKKYNSCMVQRTIVVQRETPDGRETEAPRRCGNPLTDDKETSVGVCSTCIDAWETSENFPSQQGLERIVLARRVLGLETLEAERTRLRAQKSAMC